MPTFLIPVDGSRYSDQAVDYAIARGGSCRDPVHVHLLNVQAPIAGVNVKLFVSRESLDRYYRDEAMAILDAPRRKIEATGLTCEHHIGVGDPGQVAVEYARDKACDEIVMGTHGRGAVAGVVMGSVAQKVIHLSPVPVVLVK